MNLGVLALAAALAVGAPTAPTAPAAAECAVTDATMTWGFKESFRSYISGTIANGDWSVADGATYTTPNFGWTNGTGTIFDGDGDVGFRGSIEFTGHGGILDTTVANPRLQFTGWSNATLVMDVAGTTQQGAAVDAKAVKFAAVDLSAAQYREGAVTIKDAPVTLTTAGAAAFGTYPAGERLDPVTISFTADPACTVAPPSRPGAFFVIWLAFASALAVTVITIELVLRRRRAQAPGA